MPISLGINTATIESTVCLCKDGQVIDSRSWADQSSEAERLLPAISEMMTEQGLELSDLDNVLVVQGPGSFTAIRVGIVTANTICQNSNVSLYSLTTFDLIKKMTESEYDLVALNGGGTTLIVDDGEISTVKIAEFNEGEARTLLANINDVQRNQLDEKFELVNNLLKFDEVCARITGNEQELESMRVRDLPLLPYYVKKPSIS